MQYVIVVPPEPAAGDRPITVFGLFDTRMEAELVVSEFPAFRNADGGLKAVVVPVLDRPSMYQVHVVYQTGYTFRVAAFNKAEARSKGNEALNKANDEASSPGDVVDALGLLEDDDGWEVTGVFEV